MENLQKQHVELKQHSTPQEKKEISKISKHKKKGIFLFRRVEKGRTKI
uniref:Uncharacterized protein n=1 Tax=Manihot esculenta TaxID=3983 RepID=A0A2C9UER3_MANES